MLELPFIIPDARIEEEEGLRHDAESHTGERYQRVDLSALDCAVGVHAQQNCSIEEGGREQLKTTWDVRNPNPNRLEPLSKINKSPPFDMDDMDDARIKALLATMVTSEVGRATSGLRARQATLEAANEALRKELTMANARIHNLENPAAMDLAHRFSRRWRTLLILGGLLAPGMAVKAILTKSERWAWTSVSFIVCSCVSIFAAAFGNVRNWNNRSEKALVMLCSLGMGASSFLPGYALAGFDDEYTAAAGKVAMGGGVFFWIILPPAFYYAASMWSAFDDLELGIAVTNLFKSLPYTLGSITYISTAVIRSILSADDDSPIIEERGNPIIPSFTVNALMGMVWGIQYWLGPLMKETATKTWKGRTTSPPSTEARRTMPRVAPAQ